MTPKTRVFSTTIFILMAFHSAAKVKIYTEVSQVSPFFSQGKVIFNTSMSSDGSRHYYTDNNSETREDKAITAIYERTRNSNRRIMLPGINIPADVHVTPDASKLYVTDFGREHSQIFVLTATDNGWSAPIVAKSLQMPNGATYVTSTNTGAMYFSSEGKIHCYKEGKNQVLPLSINQPGGQQDPFIAQDESFLIFVRQIPEIGDSNMFISFRIEDKWSEPEKLAAPFNLDKVDGSPYVTPDKKYLFFTSNREDEITQTFQAPFFEYYKELKKKHLNALTDY